MGEMQYGLFMKQRQGNVDRLVTLPGMHEFQGLPCSREIVAQDGRCEQWRRRAELNRRSQRCKPCPSPLRYGAGPYLKIVGKDRCCSPGGKIADRPTPSILAVVWQ